MEWFILSLSIGLPLVMVGMSVSPLAAAALAKESSAEVLAAAAQASREAHLQGRLMQGFILILIVGMRVLSVAAVAMATAGGEVVPGAFPLSSCAGDAASPGVGEVVLGSGPLARFVVGAASQVTVATAEGAEGVVLGALPDIACVKPRR